MPTKKKKENAQNNNRNNSIILENIENVDAFEPIENADRRSVSSMLPLRHYAGNEAGLQPIAVPGQSNEAVQMELQNNRLTAGIGLGNMVVAGVRRSRATDVENKLKDAPKDKAFEGNSIYKKLTA